MTDVQHRDYLFETMIQTSGRRVWLEYKLKYRRIDLTGVEFTGRTLRDYDLSDINLSHAIFLDADLAGTDFSDAYLCYADLRKCNLRNACLDRANLRLAILNEASLVDACLCEALMKGTHLAGADLTGADLTGADLTAADLRGASLKYARLTGAVLKGANLADANLTGAVIDDGATAQARNWRRTVQERRQYRSMPTEPFARHRDEQIVEIKPGGSPAAGAGTGAGIGAGTGAGTGTEAGAGTGEREKLGRANRLREGEFEVPQWEVEPDLESTAGCCQVLEVSLDAPLDEIVKAFRRKAKLYHPDMVRHLPEKLQSLSSQEFQRLHRAYERLTRRTTRSLEGQEVNWPAGMPRRMSPYEYTCDEYEKLAAANPNNSSIVYNMGWKYFEAERHVEALNSFQRVLELDPKDDDARYNMTICRICIELMNASQA